MLDRRSGTMISQEFDTLALDETGIRQQGSAR